MATCYCPVQCVEGGSGRYAGRMHILEGQLRWVAPWLGDACCRSPSSSNHLRPKGGLDSGVSGPSRDSVKLRFGNASSGNADLRPLHALSTTLNTLEASGRLPRLMAASSPGHAARHPTRRFTTCTCSAAVGRSTVDALIFCAVTRISRSLACRRSGAN